MFAFLAVAISYYLTGKLGLYLAIPPGVATPVWPPSGIALAALLLLGVRSWPAVFVGSALLNGHVLFGQPSTLAPWGVLFTAAVIATGSTVQAVAGATLVRKWAGSNPFEAPKQVLQFALLATVICMIAATVGVSVTYWMGLATATEVFVNWRTWWLGDFVGVVLVAPPILLFPTLAGWRRRKPLELVESIAVFGFVLFFSEVVFGDFIGFGKSNLPLDFLLAIPLLWAGLRLRSFEVSLCVLLVMAAALAATHAGVGPFIRPNVNDSLFFSQAFVGTCSVSVLALSALLLERQQAQAAMQVSVRKMAAINKELQAFTYGVSHDLKEPVRTVSTQLQVLKWKHGEGLDEDAQQLIGFCIDSAKRMTSLIDALLDYGRTETSEFNPREIDMVSIVERAKKDLGTAISTAQAEIIMDSLPRVRGDEIQLARLMQNLLSNAIKFRGDRSPQVRITAARHDSNWMFEIRDNGVGFVMPPGERLFEPFRRLHGRQEYPGSGLGLSVCRKIIERHGGKIWADSAPGHGSVFTFTLPA